MTEKDKSAYVSVGRGLDSGFEIRLVDNGEIRTVARRNRRDEAETVARQYAETLKIELKL